MTTPNKMPKSTNKIRQAILAGLIETKPVSRVEKRLARNKDDIEVVVNQTVTTDSLRFPLAQNVSAESVEALAKRWLK